MGARVGAEVGTSAVWLIKAMIPKPADRPKIAVRMGIPIAITVPKVKSKMNTAAVRPTTSETWVDGLDTFCPR
jgi:hypothetical protein